MSLPYLCGEAAKLAEGCGKGHFEAKHVLPEDNTDTSCVQRATLAGARNGRGDHRHAVVLFNTRSKISMEVAEIVVCSMLMDESFEDATRRIGGGVGEGVSASDLNDARGVAARFPCQCGV